MGGDALFCLNVNLGAHVPTPYVASQGRIQHVSESRLVMSAYAPISSAAVTPWTRESWLLPASSRDYERDCENNNTKMTTYIAP